MLKQIIFEMKHQKMMTWVSISGTALSIFLIMSLFLSEQIKSVDVAPESNRHRILMAVNLHVQGNTVGNSSTSGLNKDMIDQLYSKLDGIEKTSYIFSFPWNNNVNLRGNDPVSVVTKRVDNEFWNIYDFTFIDGKPYDKADVIDEAKKIVISRSLARQLFDEDSVAGREIQVNCVSYVISGVIEDVNPLLQSTYAQVYVPFYPPTPDEEYFGNVNMVLLMKEGIDAKYVKEQVENRYKTVNRKIKTKGDELIYHHQPYTSKELGSGLISSNYYPGMRAQNRTMWILYTILLLLPAINLSSMTRSRLRHRVSEIGVRRAFGAKRKSIMWQTFIENMLITLLGGIIGFGLSAAFIMLASHLFFVSNGINGTSLEIINARPSFEMLFQWKTIIIALIFCLVLNILSASVPAWQASRVEPAVAIAKSHC